MEFSVEKTRIRIIMGDITEQNTDTVVNAANNSLMGGGGVDGAIHRKGGPTILKECKKIRETEWPNGLSTGNAVITKGGNLKAKYVIHTVGPIWNGGDQGEPELLASAYRNSLRLAVSKGLKTIAFPSISTGAYNYPIEKASRVAMETVVTFLKEENQLDEIVFALFSSAALDSYKDTAKDLVKMRALRDFTREHETEARII